MSSAGRAEADRPSQPLKQRPGRVDIAEERSDRGGSRKGHGAVNGLADEEGTLQDNPDIHPDQPGLSSTTTSTLILPALAKTRVM